MIGADIRSEEPTNIGRIDAIIETKDSFCIVEFKIRGTADDALAQIEETKYYQPYQGLGKKIVLFGILFDLAIKNVSDIKMKVQS